MVYVDWEKIGVCKYWMLGGSNRCYRQPCKWLHCLEQDIKLLWDDPAARDRFVAGEKQPKPVSGRESP